MCSRESTEVPFGSMLYNRIATTTNALLLMIVVKMLDESNSSQKLARLRKV
jgi:hypothetical protein